jgi:cytochrome c-type biogenesis protein CcmE
MDMEQVQPPESQPRQGNPLKFIIGGVVIVGSIIYLLVSSLQANVQYFLTVDEVLTKQQSGELSGRNVRISGAVLGESIDYNLDTLDLSFTIAHVPAESQLLEDEGGLASALHQAVTDPERSRLKVVYNGPKPDLLVDEAQAILTGQIQEDGVFLAEELLLKCPTKYEGAVPDQIES